MQRGTTKIRWWKLPYTAKVWIYTKTPYQALEHHQWKKVRWVEIVKGDERNNGEDGFCEWRWKQQTEFSSFLSLSFGHHKENEGRVVWWLSVQGSKRCGWRGFSFCMAGHLPLVGGVCAMMAFGVSTSVILHWNSAQWK